MPVFMNASSPQLSVKNWKICSGQQHFQKKNTQITTLDAMLDLGILRLASRISELKKAGVPIRRDLAKVTNRHGETCNVLRYSLDGSLAVIPDKPGGEE